MREDASLHYMKMTGLINSPATKKLNHSKHSRQGSFDFTAHEGSHLEGMPSKMLFSEEKRMG
jgi:hypothetical protein